MKEWHVCRASGCMKPIFRSSVLCSTHLKQVPKVLRVKLCAAHQTGAEFQTIEFLSLLYQVNRRFQKHSKCKCKLPRRKAK